MIVQIITEALIYVGFDPTYIIYGTYKEVNQRLEKLPLLPAPGIDVIACPDMVFSGSTNFRQYGGADDDLSFRILFARKNHGNIDAFGEDRLSRALSMLPYYKRFVLKLNTDERIRRPSGYIQKSNFEPVYHLFDTDVDGILATVSIPNIEDLVGIC